MSRIVSRFLPARIQTRKFREQYKVYSNGQSMTGYWLENHATCLHLAAFELPEALFQLHDFCVI
jgi:hypothetical protein